MQKKELIAAIRRKKSFLCVGLDPEIGKIPTHLLEATDPVFEFNRAVVDATRDLCVAYKPNLAFYEALGPAGMITLQKTVAYIGADHFIIADAKRGDIGNTGRMYAEAFFQIFHADAVTVAPYMGEDSVKPFLGFDGKWAVVLGLTSNAGSADFQTRILEDNRQMLWENVLTRAATWGTSENMMFVIGATHPEAFERVRKIVPDHFLLVPGVGAQGGDLAGVCRYGMNGDCGLLVNASRGIIYAGSGLEFAEAARDAAEGIRKEMAEFL